jgi:hypothetical protein
MLASSEEVQCCPYICSQYVHMYVCMYVQDSKPVNSFIDYWEIQGLVASAERICRVPYLKETKSYVASPSHRRNLMAHPLLLPRTPAKCKHADRHC